MNIEIKHGLEEAVVVALGSNLAGAYPSTEALLEACLAAFPKIGLRVVKRSSWWRSAAWPPSDHPEYLNGVALVETKLDAGALLASLLDLEHAPSCARASEAFCYGAAGRDCARLDASRNRTHRERSG